MCEEVGHGKKKNIQQEVQITTRTVCTYRGAVRKSQMDKLALGDAFGFIELQNCYRFHEPDSEAETAKKIGSYEILGSGEYLYFTGIILFRSDSVVNFAYHKESLSGEPIELLKKGKLLDLVKNVGEDSLQSNQNRTEHCAYTN